jgi:hypothetical protein
MRLRTAASVLAAILAAASFLVFMNLAVGQLFADAVFTISLLFMTVFVGATLYAMRSGAPFVPLDPSNVREMVALARIGPGDKVADLGSGDGRILIAAAKAGAEAEGWEINPLLWALSLWNIRRAGVAGKARAHCRSYWDRSMAGKTVVTLFLITGRMPQMERKLMAELPAGARVVSYGFQFPTWPLKASNGKKMYLYEKSVKDS